MNSTKSATSIMYAGCTDGLLLPPYVVYKPQTCTIRGLLEAHKARDTIAANLGGLSCDVLRIGL